MSAEPTAVALGLPLELDYVRQENRSIIDRLISALETEPDLAARFYRIMSQIEQQDHAAAVISAK